MSYRSHPRSSFIALSVTTLCVMVIAHIGLDQRSALAESKTPTAKSQSVSATDFLRGRVAEVLKLAAIPVPKPQLKAKVDAQLLAIIKPMMNFSAMSEASLGKHWPARSKAERARFVSLFEELVFHSYIKKIRSADSGHRLEYEDETSTARGATVEAVAITSQQEIELRFVLQRQNELYVAEDVVIDEVSLVQNYREQFNKIITKDGFEALLKKMERQIAKVK